LFRKTLPLYWRVKVPHHFAIVLLANESRRQTQVLFNMLILPSVRF
jgi:hypothetical protein